MVAEEAPGDLSGAPRSCSAGPGGGSQQGAVGPGLLLRRWLSGGRCLLTEDAQL